MESEHLYVEKFANPRNIEGDPQTERLEYIRNFFDFFAKRNNKIVAGCVVGSTVKGYGLESSDIDAAVFYFEEIPVGEDAMKHYQEFYESFEKSVLDYKTMVEAEGKPSFYIDTKDFFNIRALINIKDGKIILREDLERYWTSIIMTLCFPSVENKDNPFKISYLKTFIKNTIAMLDDNKKKWLYRELMSLAYNMSSNEANRIEKRQKDFDRSNYESARIKSFKNKLKNEFGIEIPETP